MYERGRFVDLRVCKHVERVYYHRLSHLVARLCSSASEEPAIHQI